MLKMVTLECPKCGAALNADDREVFFCSHCGAKIMLHNENEHVYHIIKESSTVFYEFLGTFLRGFGVRKKYYEKESFYLIYYNIIANYLCFFC